MNFYLPAFLAERNRRRSSSEESDERVADDTSSTFNETESPATADENLCKGSHEQLRNQYHELENKIKQLTENYDRALEQKNAEVLHYAKSLKEQEGKHREVLRTKETQLQERNSQIKSLKITLEDLRKHNFKSLNEMKQSLESAYIARLKSIQKQLDNCQKRLSEEQSRSVKLNEDLKYFMSRLSQEQSKSKNLEVELSRQITSYRCLRDSYNNDLKSMAMETDYFKTRLSKKNEELTILQEELREKTTRLASSFEKRLKHDQRRVENTVEFNTPTDVEKDFSDFFDGERIDACDVIETILNPKPEEEIDVEIYYPRLACIVFVAAYELMKEAKEAACDLFTNVTKQLIDETPRRSQELCLVRKESGLSSHFPITIDVSVGKKDAEISSDVLDGLMLCLKQTAHLCNLDCFENVVKEIVWERWNKYLQEEERQFLPASSQEVLPQLTDYIQACIRLTWRMVTQVPPLQLEYKAVKFDKDIHKLTRFQCNTGYSPNENIACYLWPALLEAGGRIIFPGEVLCKTVYSDYDVV